MNERGYESLFIEGSLAAFVEDTQPCILRVIYNIRLDNEDLPPSPKNTATGNNIYSANTPSKRTQTSVTYPQDLRTKLSLKICCTALRSN